MRNDLTTLGMDLDARSTLVDDLRCVFFPNDDASWSIYLQELTGQLVCVLHRGAEDVRFETGLRLRSETVDEIVSGISQMYSNWKQGV